jgi:hypothetical protein
MENAIFGFMGAILGAVLGFIGSILSSFAKSKDTSKDILTRTVTNERAQWRKELREVVAEFVENALRIVAKDPGGSLYTLEKQRVLIRLRLNPKPEHLLDSNILRNVTNIMLNVKASDSIKLTATLDEFEQNVQNLLKQEWDKSKKEAESGVLHVNEAELNV